MGIFPPNSLDGVCKGILLLPTENNWVCWCIETAWKIALIGSCIFEKKRYYCIKIKGNRGYKSRIEGKMAKLSLIADHLCGTIGLEFLFQLERYNASNI